MAPYVSTVEDLTLHGPRVLGFATNSRVAARYQLDLDVVAELLLDYEAHGWTRHADFAGSGGWHLTEVGRVENERRLSSELDRAGGREVVAGLHADFLPLNGRFGTTCTQWQIRPTRTDPMALNDHSDWAWDERVMRSLEVLGTAFRQVCAGLSDCLKRFDGYAERYASALSKVDAGERRWVDAPDIDSCHTVWVQFHEDLLATLGIPRGSDG